MSSTDIAMMICWCCSMSGTVVTHAARCSHSVCPPYHGSMCGTDIAYGSNDWPDLMWAGIDATDTDSGAR
eukprot:2323171-Rhodomonas_salina.4